MMLADYLVLYCTARYLSARAAVACPGFLGKPSLTLTDERNDKVAVGQELQGHFDHVVAHRT